MLKVGTIGNSPGFYNLLSNMNIDRRDYKFTL